MNVNNLNQVAVWVAMKGNEIDIKEFTDGYPYKNKGVIMKSSMLNPVYRYAKNYYKDKTKYSLCMITDDNNAERVEKWLDEIAPKIKASDLGKFKLLDIKYDRKT